MKKSRIILPAVALLTISTVAAASSTVAWFSATREITINTNEVGVYNPESNLEIVLTGVSEAGSKVKDNDPRIIDLPSYLRDGSVDLNSGKVYKKDLVATDTYNEVTNFTSESALINDKETVIYRATSWKMTFSMKDATPDSYAIFLNISNLATSFTHKAVSEKAEEIVYKSLRLGLKYDGGFVVVAPFYDATNDNSLAYVKGTSSTGTYDKAIKTNSAKIGTSEITTDTLNGDGYKDTNAYVGTIAGGKDKSLEVTAYLWFEGMDKNCVNGAGSVLNTKVNAALSFYSVRLLKA